jgi:uncharacterized protein YcbX
MVENSHLPKATLACLLVAGVAMFWCRRRKRRLEAHGDPVINELWVFPVKSCRGFQVHEAELTKTGIKYDREWVVLKEGADGTYASVNLKSCQKLALVSTSIDEAAGLLRLSHAVKGSITVPLAPFDNHEVTHVQYDSYALVGKATRESDDVATWLSEAVGQNVALFRVTGARDPSSKPGVVPASAVVAGQNFSALMLIGSQTIDQVRRFCGDETVDAHRFRGNVVIASAAAFDECTYRSMTVGGVRLQFSRYCNRCPVTAVVDTGVFHRSFEPLRTLRAKFSSPPADGSTDVSKPVCGINIFYQGEGKLRVGDVVHVEERGSMPVFGAATPDPTSPV